MMEGYEKYENYELGMTSQTEKGTKYKTFAVGGIVEEGHRFGHWSTSKEDIWHAFYTVFLTEKMINRGKEIKWRRFPEWVEREVLEETEWLPSGSREVEKILLYQITARFVWE